MGPVLADEPFNGSACRTSLAHQRLVAAARSTIATTDPLKDLVRDGLTPQSRLAALYWLEGLDALDPELVLHAIVDDHWGVRVHALRLSERWLDRQSVWMNKLHALVHDSHPRVRLQLVLTLGESQDSKVWQTLAELAAREGGDPWMQAAIVSFAHHLLDEILNQLAGLNKAQALLNPLVAVVGARHVDEEIGLVLQTVAGLGGNHSELTRIACLDGLNEGLRQGSGQRLSHSAGQMALRQLLAVSSANIQISAAKVAAQLSFSEVPALRAAFDIAKHKVLDPSQDMKARLAAMGLLATALFSILKPTAEQLVDPHQPVNLRLSVFLVRRMTQVLDLAYWRIGAVRRHKYSKRFWMPFSDIIIVW